MGLYDRDYVRNAPPPRGFSTGGGIRERVRGWGVTHWLIAVCVVVFVVDGLLHRAFPATFCVIDPPTFTDADKPKLRADGSYVERGIEILNESVFDEVERIPPGQIIVELSRLAPGLPFGVRTYSWIVPSGLVRSPSGVMSPMEGAKIPFLREQVLFVPPIQKYLQFTTAQGLMYPSAKFGLVGFEFWRFFGYQFLHGDWMHLLFNMMGLWFFGPEVERFLGKKRFFAFYLLCGFFGALLFMILNGIGVALQANDFANIPPFLPSSPYLPLIGASGSVYGVIIAGAYLAPNDVALVLYIIPMKLRTLAIALTVFAVATLLTRGPNAGGQAAHLGGAIAGWYFIRKHHMLHNFFDLLGRADPTSRSNRTRREQRRSGRTQQEVDRILDKVHASGIQSLTEDEKRTLREASRL